MARDVVNQGLIVVANAADGALNLMEGFIGGDHDANEDAVDEAALALAPVPPEPDAMELDDNASDVTEDEDGQV